MMDRRPEDTRAILRPMASSVVAKGRTPWPRTDAPISTSTPAEPTLVATRTVASLWRGPTGGPDATPKYVASQLPIVDREAYEIDGEVARGGIGRILRARSVHLDRAVAIKELLVPGDVTEERFVCEALLTARLQHPSIVPVYEAGRWPSGELFYAMKLVSGRSLADVLRDMGAAHDGQSPLSARLSLLPHVIAVADAMAYAHSKRLIHRDLKPANVLVGAFGETVVIDWGLAKDLADSAPPPDPLPGAGRAEGREGLTVAGAVIGTPAYMPPEQARGLPADERADVYALGAILYHLLAGALPYEGGDVRAILRAVAAGPPPPLAEREKGIPVELETIVNKAMARDPADRYPTARKLAEDLRRFTTGQIVGAHKYTRAELAQRFVRRYRTLLSVGAAALCVVAATGVVSMRRIMAAADRAAEEQVKATRRADDLTLEQARNATARDPNHRARPARQPLPVVRPVERGAGDRRGRAIARAGDGAARARRVHRRRALLARRPRRSRRPATITPCGSGTSRRARPRCSPGTPTRRGASRSSSAGRCSRAAARTRRSASGTWPPARQPRRGSPARLVHEIEAIRAPQRDGTHPRARAVALGRRDPRGPPARHAGATP